MLHARDWPWFSISSPGLGGLSVRTHLNWSFALLCDPHHVVEVIKSKSKSRTTDLEAIKEEAKKDTKDLKEGANFAGQQLQEKSQD